MKQSVRLATAGSAHIIAAWLFLIGAMLSGVVGVYRMMSPGATVAPQSNECMCLGVLLGIIAAVLALLGIHRQATVMALSVGPGFQGAHGSGDDDT